MQEDKYWISKFKLAIRTSLSSQTWYQDVVRGIPMIKMFDILTFDNPVTKQDVKYALMASNANHLLSADTANTFNV